MATSTRSEYIVVADAHARVDGVLRTGRRPSSVVVIQTHPRLPSDENLVVWPMLDLPARGIDTFAYNNRYANSTAGTEIVTVWEDIALDEAAVVAEMRRRGYRSVVLYGYSAGGPTVAYYQAVAERGNAAFNGGAALSGFEGFFDGAGPTRRERRLPPADGLIFQNSTTGTGWSFLARLDPSVVDEASARRDPALDMFEPANGYDSATGAGAYGRAFLERYYRAQGERMQRLIAGAQERLEETRSGRGRFRDDDLLVIAGIRAEPASIDLALASATQASGRSHPGGGETIVRSDRAVVPNYERRNHSFRDGGTVHTLRSFLSYRAVRVLPGGYDPDAVAPERAGIDLVSSNSNTAAMLASVTVPVLVCAGTADTQVHLPHAELLYNAAVATGDRSKAFIAGAEHDLTPAAPGAPDTRNAHLDVVVDWLSTRYLEGPGA